MKPQLTLLALIITCFAFSQDSAVNSSFQKRTQAAMEAQDQTQKITVRTDSTKNWKKLLTVQNKSEWTWWDYTKEFLRTMWKDKPYLIVLGGIFLLIGIWKLIKRFFE